jgi:integrase
MARRTRSAQLETRTARLKLAVRRKPYTARVAPGIRLGYRRNAGTGSWSVICADGAGGSWLKGFAVADDYETADGVQVLDFWQAQDRARTLARAGQDGADDSGRPMTVAEAIDRYQIDLQARGGDSRNATRVRRHLPAGLASKTISLLTARELRHWRDALLKAGLRPSTVKRISKCLKAALTAVAAHDARITNRDAWGVGLASLPDSEQSRNVILDEDAVRAIVAAAYEINREFGTMVEVAAVTGGRASQIARLEVRDLQNDRAPRLMMPSSRKGKGVKRITRSPVPIGTALARSLRHAAAGREEHAPLLIRADGGPWRPGNHGRPFAEAVTRAGLDPKVITLYALRHSSIVRQLLANVPIRVVATTHDTSTSMIERTYSAHISDHSDVLIRRGMLDIAQPAGSNLVPLPVKA